MIINGDLATDGSPPRVADYLQFAKLISPPVERGIATHLTMGNCDRRSLFTKTLREILPNGTTIGERLVGILPTMHANFFLLDSLHDTQRTITKGSLGKAQMDWLTRSLHRTMENPAIVVGHHHINGTLGIMRCGRMED